MKTMKKLKLGLLLSCVAVLLTGCFGKKKKSDSQKVDYSGQSSKKKKGTKRWDPNLEAYVFDGDDNDMLASNSKNSEFQKVYFDYDRTNLRDDQRPVAEYDAKIARAKVEEGNNIIVIGKSDRKCISEVYNTAVSQQRADTMAKEFTVAGISRDKIMTIGKGDSEVEVDVPGAEPLNRCAVVQIG